MITFIGDYTVRLDSKGRLSFPAAFKRQSREVAQDGFVLKRDLFESCLIMYPMEEWERQNKIIRSRTNPYNKEHARFLRMFFSGTAEVILDANNRMLLPKRLMEYAGISDEVVLAGQSAALTPLNAGTLSYTPPPTLINPTPTTATVLPRSRRAPIASTNRGMSAGCSFVATCACPS